MNMNEQDSEYHHKSGITSKEDLHLLAAAGWRLARVTLFSRQFFADKENQAILKQILHYIIISPDPYQGYLEFCQRMLLLDQYLESGETGSFSAPGLAWFSPYCEMGFSPTEKMYRQIVAERGPSLFFVKQWKDLAEAILDITEFPCTENFEYWMNWFNERGEFDELFLLIRCILSPLVKMTPYDD